MLAGRTARIRSTARMDGRRRRSAQARRRTRITCCSGWGNTVVDATFSHVGPMSAGEMRELAKNLPMPQGNRALAPPILASLPQESLDKQTTHFAQGPAGYAGAGGVLPPGLVGFDRDAEAVTANYSLNSGPATLTLIDYPTPQMAEAQEKLIRAYIKAGSGAQPAFPKPLAGFRPGLAGGEPQRTDGGAGERRCDPRRKPQVAGAGALLCRPDEDVAGEGQRDCEDQPVPDGPCDAGDHRVQRGGSAWVLFRWWQGAIPGRAGQACVMRCTTRNSSGCISRTETEGWEDSPSASEPLTSHFACGKRVVNPRKHPENSA